MPIGFRLPLMTCYPLIHHNTQRPQIKKLGAKTTTDLFKTFFDDYDNNDNNIHFRMKRGISLHRHVNRGENTTFWSNK